MDGLTGFILSLVLVKHLTQRGSKVLVLALLPTAMVVPSGGNANGRCQPTGGLGS
jgi:hypothetical protein